MTLQSRIKNLRRKLAEREMDGILISQPENRYYLSGFDGSDGYLLITEGEALLATDSRYTEQAKEQCPDYEIFKITGGIKEWFPQALKKVTCRRLGFESGNLTFNLYQEMAKVAGEAKIEFRPQENLIEGLRAIKEPTEVELISKAAALSDAAMDYFRRTARAGMTELEAAWEIEKFMREHSSQSMPFEPIVASGIYAALPHHRPSEKTLAEDEPIVVDIGAKVGYYASDLTRTICLGRPSDKLKSIYDIVLTANENAAKNIKTGVTGEQADKLARDIISAAGYGEMFGHGLGHGVGLNVHELPRLGTRSTDIITDGMIVTIEPGIYIPGWGGIRIEDLAIIVDGRPNLLSHTTRELTTGQIGESE